MAIIKGVKVITILNGGFTTPLPPTLLFNDNDNTISATHTLGSSEIAVSINNGAFVQYDGAIINVGNVFRPVGYYRFKIKSATNRNESAIVSSNGFTVTSTGENIPGNFTYPLSVDSATSAGVYNMAGELVRTLWNGTNELAGTHTKNWDGKLDDLTQSPDGDYEIKVLSNKVTYEWEGSYIGNTGTHVLGMQKMLTYEQPRGMTILNGTIFIAGAYDESRTGHISISESDVNGGIIRLEPYQGYPSVVEFIANDGTNIYWSGFDPAQAGGMESFVNVTKAADNSAVIFANGTSNVVMNNGITYPSVLAYDLTAGAGENPGLITGMAVQKTGNYLFVSRGRRDQVMVVDKRTSAGGVVQTLTIPAAGKMAIDTDDNLWLQHGGTLEKFTVNTDGTLTTTGITITGFSIGGFAVAPTGTTMAVCDVTNQIVKFFNKTTGGQTGSLGTPGGYITDSTVTNLKFYWRDVRQEYLTFCTYAPDGTLYIGDPKNARTLHYNGNTFIKSFGWRTATYRVASLKNDPKRLFVEFLEYEIDYSKPLAGTNGSWTLKKNWEGNFGAEYIADRKMSNITKLSNGRTYGLVSGSGFNANTNYLIELVEGGVIRYTGIPFSQRESLLPDGSKFSNPAGGAIGQTSTFYKTLFLGFDGSNNPIYGESQVLATTPVLSIYDPWPAYSDIVGDKVITFQKSAQAVFNRNDYHLGALKITGGASNWHFKTARGTSQSYSGPYPTGGAFDNGNGVNTGENGAGGSIATFGDNLFWNYHGEFWKGTQTNKWHHVDAATGLYIGQFGTANRDYLGIPSGTGIVGADGNCLVGDFVEVDGQGYLYHNGETFGVHRWKVNGLGTINRQSAIFPTAEEAEPILGIDLMEGITWEMSTLPDTFRGWSVDTPQYGNDGQPHIKAFLGMRSFDPFKHPDIRFSAAIPTGNGVTFYRDLEVNNNVLLEGANANLSSWAIKGVINWQDTSPGDNHYNHALWLEVQDSLHRGIARFSPMYDEVGQFIQANMQKMHIITDDYVKLYQYNQPFEISFANDVLTFKFAHITFSTTARISGPAGGTDPANAARNSPKYFTFMAYNGLNPSNPILTVSIQELRFIKG